MKIDQLLKTELCDKKFARYFLNFKKHSKAKINSKTKQNTNNTTG